MPIDHIMTLRQNCYARARVTADPVNKRTLIEIGDMHLFKVEKQKRARAINTPAVEATIEAQVI